MAAAAKRRHIDKAKAAASSQPPKPNDPVQLLKDQWKKRGIVIMNSEFKHMHQGTFQYLVEKADELAEPLYIDPNAGESQRVHQKCTVNEKYLEIVRPKNCY